MLVVKPCAGKRDARYSLVLVTLMFRLRACSFTTSLQSLITETKQERSENPNMKHLSGCQAIVSLVSGSQAMRTDGMTTQQLCSHSCAMIQLYSLFPLWPLHESCNRRSRASPGLAKLVASLHLERKGLAKNGGGWREPLDPA